MVSKRPLAHHLLPFFLSIIAFAVLSHGRSSRFFHWKIKYANVTRLCETKSIVTVNGRFPGPNLYVNEGDRVIVNVTNLVPNNITIHWHGVRQILSAWADGPAYITQCPIQTGRSYVYRFRVIGQRGTLYWHAHISWLRVTVHGAFIIRPKKTIQRSFTLPKAELPPIILGEWWRADVEAVIKQALTRGTGYNTSDARTINGQPGYPNNCSVEEMTVFNVRQNSSYTLHIINAALNVQLYFSVANHTMTVVEADAAYTKPLTTDIVVVAPGQTTSVVIEADQPIDNYFMTASVFSPANATFVPYLALPTSAVLSYDGAGVVDVGKMKLPTFPSYDDKYYVENLTHSLKGEREIKGYYNYDVPTTIDEDMFITVSYIIRPFNVTSTNLMTAMNNITFETPPFISVQQAYYYNISGVYEANFPDNPPYPFDYTGSKSNLRLGELGTTVKVLEFNQSVQIVFQDTSMFAFESHPIHLHGYSVYVVGSGFGNYNSSVDPANFNLKDPPARNTVAVPSGGWTAIRFRATNPGAWFVHCHIEIHTSWGMSMVLIVKNGKGVRETLPPPPRDYPIC